MKISLPTGVPKYDEKAGIVPYTERMRDYLSQILDELRRFSNNGIDLRQNCRVTYVTVTSSTAGSEITVAHNLGVTPFMYLWNIDQNGVVYDSRRTSWNDTTIYVKCSVAGASIRITVFG